jgi:hypothetical protein
MRIPFLALCLGGLGACTIVKASPAPAAEAPRYGALMAEIGRRFELFGHAAKAHRYELAAYELHELEEIFEGELSRAEAPEVGGVNLDGLREAFIETHLEELSRAVRSRNDQAIAAAFSNAAATCSGCHKATEHAFIEIPSELGAPVPRLDPLP